MRTKTQIKTKSTGPKSSCHGKPWHCRGCERPGTSARAAEWAHMQRENGAISHMVTWLDVACRLAHNANAFLFLSKSRGPETRGIMSFSTLGAQASSLPHLVGRRPFCRSLFSHASSCRSHGSTGLTVAPFPLLFLLLPDIPSLYQPAVEALVSAVWLPRLRVHAPLSASHPIPRHILLQYKCVSSGSSRLVL